MNEIRVNALTKPRKSEKESRLGRWAVPPTFESLSNETIWIWRRVWNPVIDDSVQAGQTRLLQAYFRCYYTDLEAIEERKQIYKETWYRCQIGEV